MAKQVNARAISQGNVGFTVGRLMAYERLMVNKPGRVAKNSCKCEDCPYYHPDWEHRMCLHTKCVWGKDIDVFKAAKDPELVR